MEKLAKLNISRNFGDATAAYQAARMRAALLDVMSGNDFSSAAARPPTCGI